MNVFKKVKELFTGTEKEGKRYAVEASQEKKVDRHQLFIEMLAQTLYNRYVKVIDESLERMDKGFTAKISYTEYYKVDTPEGIRYRNSTQGVADLTKEEYIQSVTDKFDIGYNYTVKMSYNFLPSHHFDLAENMLSDLVGLYFLPPVHPKHAKDIYETLKEPRGLSLLIGDFLVLSIEDGVFYSSPYHPETKEVGRRSVILHQQFTNELRALDIFGGAWLHNNKIAE